MSAARTGSRRRTGAGERAESMSEAVHESDLRVILVGRSPLEGRLRRDPGIELVRAPDVLNAVGELGAPDEGGPERSVVVLSPVAVAASDLGSTVRALRRVDGAAPVVGVGDAAKSEGAATAGVLDAWIDESADGASLRASLRSSVSQSEPVRTGAVEPEQPAPARVAGAAPHAGDVSQSAFVAEPGGELDEDERIQSALLLGRDIVGPCLDRLRRRLTPVEFDYVAHRVGQAEPDVRPGMVRSPVEHHGRVLAWLIGPAQAADALAAAGRWLGRWMAVGEQHSQLRTAAFTDPLTGAWNRRYLARFLAVAIGRARAGRHDLSLLLFDIDDFKHYNDSYGHPAGDEILCETVRLLNSVIRPTDRVCRVGGDEFAVVFDEPEGPRDPASRHPASIFDLAKRFQRQINSHRFPKLGEEARGRLSISGGLATFPWDASDAESLLERADRLILDSKRQGKNVICIGPGARRAFERDAGATPGGEPGGSASA